MNTHGRHAQHHFSHYYENPGLLDTLCVGWEAFILSRYLLEESGSEITPLLSRIMTQLTGEQLTQALMRLTIILPQYQSIVDTSIPNAAEKKIFIDAVCREYQRLYLRILGGAGVYAVIGKFLRPDPQPLAPIRFSRGSHRDGGGKRLCPESYPHYAYNHD